MKYSTALCGFVLHFFVLVDGYRIHRYPLRERMPPLRFIQSFSRIERHWLGPREPHRVRPTPRSPPGGQILESQFKKMPKQRSRPSFLDPKNFHLPILTLGEMNVTLAEIESHMMNKGDNPADYTSSRLLISLMREQCARLVPLGNPEVQVFCSQFNARFRSFFF